MDRLAFLLRTDGTTDRIDLGPTDRSALTAMYGAIDTDAVDALQIAPNLYIWVDDEGLLKTDAVPNRWAGAIVHAVTQSSLAQELVGNVVFTSGPDDEGTTMGMDPNFATTLEGWVDRIRPLLDHVEE